MEWWSLSSDFFRAIYSDGESGGPLCVPFLSSPKVISRIELEGGNRQGSTAAPSWGQTLVQSLTPKVARSSNADVKMLAYSLKRSIPGFA